MGSGSEGSTRAEAEALADWVALHHRNLQFIYVTHGHADHFYGLSVLLSRFPDARAIATPKSVEEMGKFLVPPLDQVMDRCWPGQLPTRLVAAEPFESDTFTLEGHEFRIIEQGRTDCPHSTSLYVPSIDLVVAGDVVYNQCHMYVGDTTPESRVNWVAALDRLAALKPATVVAGHKKPGAPDSPSAIEDTKRYLLDFDRLKKIAVSDEELFTKIDALVPLVLHACREQLIVERQQAVLFLGPRPDFRAYQAVVLGDHVLRGGHWVHFIKHSDAEMIGTRKRKKGARSPRARSASCRQNAIKSRRHRAEPEERGNENRVYSARGLRGSGSGDRRRSRRCSRRRIHHGSYERTGGFLADVLACCLKRSRSRCDTGSNRWVRHEMF